jgi:hypothetical protein
MKLYSLIIVSFLTAILWRGEIHLRWGWYSLDWIGTFHWAFPLGIGVFLSWMSATLKDKDRRLRYIILATTFILGLAAYFGGSTTMMWAYSRWLGFCPRWQVLAFFLSPAVLYVFLGVVYFLIVNRLLSRSLSTTLAGIIIYAAAFPIAIMLLLVTSHIGGPNIINAIKSGFVFPIVAFGLGLPLTKESGQPGH